VSACPPGFDSPRTSPSPSIGKAQPIWRVGEEVGAGLRIELYLAACWGRIRSRAGEMKTEPCFSLTICSPPAVFIFTFRGALESYTKDESRTIFHYLAGFSIQ